MKKKAFLTLLIVLTLIVSLAGCGSVNEESINESTIGYEGFEHDILGNKGREEVL